MKAWSSFTFPLLKSIDKKFYLIIFVIAVICFVPSSIYTHHLQQKHNIDIFQDFKWSNDSEYVLPELRVTDMSIDSGGKYLNGHIVTLKIRFTYLGDVPISYLGGNITLYNSYNSKIFQADVSFDYIQNNQIWTVDIDCQNSAEIVNLYNCSLYDVSIYYTSEYIIYSNYHSIRDITTKKIN